MQEEKLVELLGNLMSIACDNCSKIQDKTQEEADEICAECPAGEQVCAILNENQRYSEIILCCECEYGAIAVEVNEERLYLCRLREGLGGFVNSNSGCSRGKRVQLKSKYITQIRGGHPPRKGAYGPGRIIISKNHNPKKEENTISQAFYRTRTASVIYAL